MPQESGDRCKAHQSHRSRVRLSGATRKPLARRAPRRDRDTQHRQPNERTGRPRFTRRLIASGADSSRGARDVTPLSRRRAVARSGPGEPVGPPSSARPATRASTAAGDGRRALDIDPPSARLSELVRPRLISPSEVQSRFERPSERAPVTGQIATARAGSPTLWTRLGRERAVDGRSRKRGHDGDAGASKSSNREVDPLVDAQRASGALPAPAH